MIQKVFIIYFLISIIVCTSNLELYTENKNNNLSRNNQEKYDFVSSVDWAEIKFLNYSLFNNVWGKKKLTNYEQYIFLNEDPKLCGWTWLWPDKGFNVKAYPEIIYGKKPWHNYNTSKYLPSKINTYDFLIKYNFKLIADGVYNTAFDIFLTDSKDPSPESITHEIMIWLNNSGMNPAGLRKPDEVVYINNDKILLYVKKSFKVEDHKFDYICFEYFNSVNNGVINLSDFLNILLDLKLIDENLYISSIEFGNEVVKGSGKMIIMEYDISVK